MTLEKARQSIGMGVVYIPFPGCSKEQYEYGVITSVNDRFVFVRYGRDIISKATRPDDLKLG
jgi:hypothetical protein